jgi:hypothetical protein
MCLPVVNAAPEVMSGPLVVDPTRMQWLHFATTLPLVEYKYAVPLHEIGQDPEGAQSET